MCGIAGVATRNPPLGITWSNDLLHNLGNAMLDSIAHRGPDGFGSSQYCEDRVWLGHRRLAIIDLEGGKQPMSTIDGELCVTFNGCIYNYMELREELTNLGHRFVTESDTEVILHAYREWGEACVQRFNGMWGFALWDESKKRLFCSRDRLGIKPFYYYWDGNTFVFGSEIKALLASTLVPREADTNGIRQYLTFQFCLGEQTLFKHINKLLPAENLVLDMSQDASPKKNIYWQPQFNVDDSHDEAELIEQLRELLEDGVRLRLRSDVPLGAHLSGGIDSSLIVELTRRLLPDTPLKTFTGAFEDSKEYDEREYSRAVAKHAGAEALETTFNAQNFVEDIEKIIWHMDEPAAGPGVFPQYGVSRLAANHVKVVLGGQGGDELFIGYARYLVAYLEECLKGAIEESAHRGDYVTTLGTIIPSLPTLQNYTPMLRSFWKDGLFEEPSKRYYRLMDRFAGVQTVLHQDYQHDSEKTFSEFSGVFEAPGATSKINKILYFDLKTHLQSLLHVEDRTSMAWGLESRVPLLDYRMVDLMASIKPTLKFKNGRLKHLFLQSIHGILPEKIWQRKDKMGFPVPLSKWSKGPLKDFVHDTLGSQNARQRNIFDTPKVLSAIDSDAPFGRTAWGALCLELWHKQFIDSHIS